MNATNKGIIYIMYNPEHYKQERKNAFLSALSRAYDAVREDETHQRFLALLSKIR